MKRYRDHRGDKIYLLLIALAVGLGLVLLYMGGTWLEKQSQQPETRGDPTLRTAHLPTIEVEGNKYRLRDRVTTVLLMGIDRESTAVSFGFRNGGQADFLRLLVIDSGRKTLTQLQIDRDTITEIVTLGITGQRSGTRRAQISLSHGFGDGGAQSCKLTVEAVSKLLMDTKINFYMALNMDGISVLNDWAGGVTVTLQDDFSKIDPTMVKGATLTLMGDQAETFVRSRMSMQVGTNEARMKRQQEYIAQLTAQLERKIAGDQSQINDVLETLEGYLLTDMPRGRLINEFWAAKDYKHMPLVAPKGVHAVGSDGFMEFRVEEESIRQIVLELLYEKVK